MSSLDNSLASTEAGNESNYYNQYLSPNAKLQRQQQAAGIYGDLANTEFGRGTGLLQEAAQGDMGLAGQYGNLQQEALQRQRQNSPFAALSGLAGEAASMYGFSHAPNMMGGGGQSGGGDGGYYGGGGDPQAF